MKATDIISTKSAEKGFYPTPPNIAAKMLEGIRFDYISTILEPSAGKGDLARAVSNANYDSRPRYRKHTIQIDCCESDPYLRQILKYNFSEDSLKSHYDRLAEIRNLPYDEELYDSRRAESDRIEREIERAKVDMRIVHDDFLTYRGHKHYDLIIMNPPFENGDLHLLHAIDLQRDGGSIVCLLNAETLRNPYTNSRKVLKKQLEDLNANIEYIDDAFRDAERTAQVDIAIVRIHIERQKEESDIWEQMEKAVAQEEMPDPELKELVAGDYIERAITYYNTEVAAGIELYKKYLALKPYLRSSLNPNDKYANTMIELKVHGNSDFDGFSINSYLRMVRMKYWSALFSNNEFVGKLTSKLRDRFSSNVSRLAGYDFSAFNIKQIMAEMSASMTEGVEEAIVALFEKLTSEHSWFPECKNTIHYYNGWRTNEAHKIGKKAIIPTTGMFSNYCWSMNTFEVSTAYNIISDIEKVFDYLDTGETKPINLLEILKAADADGKTLNIECKYFKISMYKKGTTHIMFYPETMRLVERLNIYAGRKKNWLPPNYGKAHYSDLSSEEKAVVDSFNGDGKEGSGEKKYQEIVANAAFYLEEPAGMSTLMITA